MVSKPDRGPCLILLERMMAGVDGWQVVDILRAEDRRVAPAAAADPAAAPTGSWRSSASP
jgi:CheY-like chemotaxis protein